MKRSARHEFPAPSAWGAGERGRLYWTGRNLPTDRPGVRWGTKAAKLGWLAGELLQRLSRLSVQDAYEVLANALDDAGSRPTVAPVGPPTDSIRDQAAAPASSDPWPAPGEVVTVSTRTGKRRARVEAADGQSPPSAAIPSSSRKPAG